MSNEGIKKYKFVSPGIFVQEIDQSQLPAVSNRLGPVIIGRTARGPSMRPVKVESFSDYVEIFGEPEPGGRGGDVWRDGNHQAPLYASYAAQAWLRNNTPVTVVRLLGVQHNDATTAGEAGWDTKDSSGNFNGIGTTDLKGGAYGLFLINSSSTGAIRKLSPDWTPQTGTLAAVWYINEGSIVLTGNLPVMGSSTDGTVDASGSAVLISSMGADNEFKCHIYNKTGTMVKTTTFNFNKNSYKYIRKVFNTNPAYCNPDLAQSASFQNYWLGQTFERDIDTYITTNTSTTGSSFGVIVALKGAHSTDEGSDYRMSSKPSKTGWFFSQDLQSVTGASNSYQPENMAKLFRFVCLDTGEWSQKNLKISIQDIKASTNPFDTYGVFSVVLRKANDSDNAPQVVERFSSCNLNPYSSNYIAKKIGDMYTIWDDTERRYREYGNYANQSKFIRVEMNSDVDAGAVNSEYLPFGVYGPPRFMGWSFASGSTAAQNFGKSQPAGSTFTDVFVVAGPNIVRKFTERGAAATAVFINVGQLSFTGSFRFPTLMLRSSSLFGDLSNPKDAYFGLDSSINNTSIRSDPGYCDMTFPLPAGFDSYVASAGETEYSWIFTLDDIVSVSAIHATYVSGSRANGNSITGISSDNYKGILTRGFNRFTSPLFGGFDGLDIQEKEPFNNTDLEGKSTVSNYAYNSVKMAFDTCADPEVVEYNLMACPGLTNETLTSQMLAVCESRGDALAVIDLKGGFIPGTENNLGDAYASNKGDVDTTISNLRARGLNTSYGCAYYPWVQAVDSINGATLWMPPSIAALGVMASSETKSELWFAPAGFNRGGLTEGAAGIPVVGVREKLTSKQRDKLYEANINSIASFPSEGIVIFGQKTLQVTPSALDRVNVRRLMIYLKKEVSRMAATILFDQNVKVTWNRFLSKVNPFLMSVKTRLGLTDYKVILDETTTTPDLVDRNVMYAKILLKPARAIEYIAIDFVISATGASFAE